MKRTLLTTTALAFIAGSAAAEVKLTGYAEMGLTNSNWEGISNGTTASQLANDGATLFHTDLDVKFSLSGATDNGITFGATIDLDEVSSGIGTVSPASVWIEGSYGKLTMGDTDGAFDWAMAEVGFGSAITDDHTTHAGFNFNSGLDGDYNGLVARYEYSFGDFSFALSAEQDRSGAQADPALGVALKYGMDMGGSSVGIGLGYQQIDSNNNVIGASLTAGFGDFDMKANYSQTEAAGEKSTHVGVGVGFTMDALLLEANYGRFSGEDMFGMNLDRSGWGVAANYDLGGGAVIMAGYGRSNYDSDNSTLTVGANATTLFKVVGETVTWSGFSFGLGLSF